MNKGGMKGVRVALVHDYLVQFGGAERVLQALMELFPHAPVFTLLYNRAAPGISIDERRLRTS
ncbi:glycosyltransferase family 4 protein, partial [Patescibacteria group bacterium]|nr:glycosyltransferase family 4 protein [Patescibacteria group bacterium]